VSLSREAATGKARSPLVERRARRTTSEDDEAEWRRRQLVKFVGEIQRDFPLITRMSSLNSVRCGRTAFASEVVRGALCCGRNSTQNAPCSGAAALVIDCIGLTQWRGMQARVANGPEIKPVSVGRSAVPNGELSAADAESRKQAASVFVTCDHRETSASM